MQSKILRIVFKIPNPIKNLLNLSGSLPTKCKEENKGNSAECKDVVPSAR